MLLEKFKLTRPLYRSLRSLEDKLKGEPFPGLKRVKQITVYHCGPAVIQALYSFLGVNIGQKGIPRSIRAQKKIKDFGLNVGDLARAAKIAGKGEFSFWRKNNSSTSDLDRAINRFGYPVGVEWQGVFYENEDEDNGHFSIVTGFDRASGTLRICDPYKHFAGIDRKFMIKEFLKRWWDDNQISVAGTTRKRTIVDNKVMFVITPKGETWPKKLGMIRL